MLLGAQALDPGARFECEPATSTLIPCRGALATLDVDELAHGYEKRKAMEGVKA